MASTLADEGVLARAAVAVATQFVVKLDVPSLGDVKTWRAVGRQLVEEANWLRETMAFVDRQIIIVLPKLAPMAVQELHGWLMEQDRRIARTILNAAISASVPRAMAERYLSSYHAVEAVFARQEPQIASTMANGTFMATDPIAQATRHLAEYERLLKQYEDTDVPRRTLARHACRAERVTIAGKKFVERRRRVIEHLVSLDIEVTVARTLADMAAVSADPLAKGDELYRRFNEALRFARAMCHRAARTIALSACGSPDPIAAAQRFITHYDQIVELIKRHDKRHAHEVATHTFRSDKPFAAARRYLREWQRRGASRVAV
ncbi:MAG: hypothetical protein ACKVS9_04775 [Phycisphaerae bacterium]